LITFTSNADNLAEETFDGLYLHDTDSGETEAIKTISIAVDGAVSADGHFFVYFSTTKDGYFHIYRKNLTYNTDELIAEDIDKFGNVAADGGVVSFSKIVDGVIQSFIWDQVGDLQPTHILAGQVTDATGHPLALVTLQDDR
jgi:hypothetical protein